MSKTVSARTRARLVLPGSARPKFVCEICGAGSYSAEENVRHVTRCARKNDDAIEKLVAMNKAKDPLGHVVDHEALDFQRRRFGRR